MLSSSLKCFLMYMHNPVDDNRLYHVVSSLKCFLMYTRYPGDDNGLYHVVFVSQVLLNVYVQYVLLLLRLLLLLLALSESGSGNAARGTLLN